MAQFEVIEDEGVSFVKVTLTDETVRAERGALRYLTGEIKIDAKIPSMGGVIKRMLAEQSVIRPRYKGTGELYLESSVGGFHIFEMDNNPWILEKGSYWASDGQVEISLFRERVWTSLLTDEGFIALQTQVKGKGKVVLKSSGPVSMMQLTDERVVVDGRHVLARSGDISYRVRRATRSVIASMLSGERRLRVYEGTGQLLVSSYPYWRALLLGDDTG